MDKDLTDMECERIDFLQDKAREFLDSLTLKGERPEWTLDDLDRVINAAWCCMKDKTVKFTEREFYPLPGRGRRGQDGQVHRAEVLPLPGRGQQG